MNYANPVLLAARRIGQRLGILRPFVRAYRKLLNTAYEEKFDRYIIEDVHAGDVVWDIGANVGYFTEKFSSIVGSAGHVYAFEPSPDTCSILAEKFSSHRNVTVVKAALADYDGESSFYVSGIEGDPTNGLGGAGDGTVGVQVLKGDTYIESAHQVPNCMKIDVEGYELEVLNGLKTTLTRKELRSLYIEVHFQILAERGMPDASTRITKVLAERGFRLRWIDPSHLVASR